MSDERRIKNEGVLEEAIYVISQYKAYFFDVVNDYELSYQNLEGHILAIYSTDDASSPIALTPYFDDLRTYNVTDYFDVPIDKHYYIVDITEHTGKDLPPLAEEDSEDRFQGILGEQSIKEVIEDKDEEDETSDPIQKFYATGYVGKYEDSFEDKEEEDKVNQPSHYTFSDKFEIIDVVEEITSQYPPHLAFAIGNAVKYIARSQHKNGKQDIEKSIWYLQRVLEKYDEE